MSAPVQGSDCITVLRHSSIPSAKTWRADGTIVGPGGDAAGGKPPKHFQQHTITVSGLRELSVELHRLECDPFSIVIRGRYVGDGAGRVTRQKVNFEDQPLHAVMFDADEFTPRADPVREPVQAVDELIGACLPEAFHGASYHWQLSNSAGHPSKAGKLRAHVWFWLSTPRTSAELKAWAAGRNVDRAVFDPIQAHYTAGPQFEAGVRDPVAVRSGLVDGLLGDAVDLEIPADIVAAATANGQRRQRDPSKRTDVRDEVAEFLEEQWEVRGQTSDGAGLHIRCPNEDQHTSDTGPSSSTYFTAGTGGFARGHFKCMHAHCDHLNGADNEAAFHEAIGYRLADFHDLTDGDSDGGAEGPLHLFYAHLPDHKYIHRPTGKLWPAASVDGSLARIKVDRMRPSAWLDQHRAVQQLTWYPGRGEVIEGEVVVDGAWIKREGQRAYNLYRAPAIIPGDARAAARWRAHLRKVYPEESEAVHLERWLAQRVQSPGVKINHALVLGGGQGIGKDSLLEPVKRAVGHANWMDIDPSQMLSQFNPYVRSVVLRVNETRNLGGSDRFRFYEQSKTLISAPPDVLWCNEKFTPQYPVVNVMGVIYTTNNKTDGIFLPADDRRHFVVWSPRAKEDFADDYWTALWDWYASGGSADVGEFLRTLDLSGFNPKAHPPKTEAFFAIVAAGSDPQDAELSNVIEELGNPSALTLDDITDALVAREGVDLGGLAYELRDRSKRRHVPHLLERAGYVTVRNPDANSGMWRVAGDRKAIYVRRELTKADGFAAARRRAAAVAAALAVVPIPATSSAVPITDHA